MSKRLHPAPSRQALPLTGRLHSHPAGPPRLAGSPEKQNNKTKHKSLKPARHVLRGISPPQCERPAWPGIRACGVALGEHGPFPPAGSPAGLRSALLPESAGFGAGFLLFPHWPIFSEFYKSPLMSLCELAALPCAAQPS